MKKIYAVILAVILAAVCTLTVFAAPADNDAAPVGAEVTELAESGVTYSVVSAVVNKDYDFKEDFHDSYPYDEDFCTVGIFELNDPDPDVTLTLKNNSTGEEFVYEKNSDTEWNVVASVDHLLYDDTTQLDAQLCIHNLGSEYGITEENVDLTITVKSSLYSADFHKYPSYIANTAMTEGEGFTVDYDASSPDGKAKITVLKVPHFFELELYNTETKQTEYHDQQNSEFVFDKELEITDFDPSKGSFWFFIPGKLIMEDGYELEFTLSVMAARAKATDDTKETTPDSGKTDGATDDSATPDSTNPSGGNKNAVQTGDSALPFILGGVMIIAAAFLWMLSRKRKTT